MKQYILYPITDPANGKNKFLRIAKGSATDDAIKIAQKVASAFPPDVKLKVAVDGDKLTIKQA